jgi:hypothetical protein
MDTELDRWPALPLAAWADTYATLHMWTQIVGKIKLALAPPVNHWWHVTLDVSARGLTTRAMPYADGSFEIVSESRNRRWDVPHGERTEPQGRGGVRRRAVLARSGGARRLRRDRAALARARCRGSTDRCQRRMCVDAILARKTR